MNIPSTAQADDFIAAAALLRKKGLEVSGCELFDAISAFSKTSPQPLRQRAAWTMTEVCQATQLSRLTIQHLVQQGKLPAANVGVGRHKFWRFRPEAVREFLMELERQQHTDEDN